MYELPRGEFVFRFVRTDFDFRGGISEMILLLQLTRGKPGSLFRGMKPGIESE